MSQSDIDFYQSKLFVSYHEKLHAKRQYYTNWIPDAFMPMLSPVWRRVMCYLELKSINIGEAKAWKLDKLLEEMRQNDLVTLTETFQRNVNTNFYLYELTPLGKETLRRAGWSYYYGRHPMQAVRRRQAQSILKHQTRPINESHCQGYSPGRCRAGGNGQDNE